MSDRPDVQGPDPDDPGVPWALEADDGAPLAGRLFHGGAAAERSVLVLGALAAPQRYLRHTAAWLSQQGYGVATVDYRGVGASASAGRPTTNLDDWASDARGAVAAARAAFGARRLLVLGHSMGGMLLGYAGLDGAVDGAVIVASSHGEPRHYGGRMRLVLEAAYAVLPRLARLRGELPAWPFLFGTAVPRDVIAHWVRWGREGDFVRWDGSSSREAFRAYRGPLLAVSLADDPYVPRPAWEGLLRRYERAGVRRVVLDPRPHGTGPVGHFGLFRADTPLWARLALLGWLQSVEAVAGPSEPPATLQP